MEPMRGKYKLGNITIELEERRPRDGTPQSWVRWCDDWLALHRVIIDEENKYSGLFFWVDTGLESYGDGYLVAHQNLRHFATKL